MTTIDQPGVLVTKLHPPTTRGQTVERRRLLDVLQPQPGVNVTVVAAPAGCGKTTLLGTWHHREAARRPVAWLTIDERDNEPIVLWSHVIEAMTRACPGVGASAASVLLDGGPVREAVLPLLVNELADEDDVTLILDDFHGLSNRAAREDVEWLIAHAPASLRLVIASRTEPALSLSALRARGQLLELRAAELAFTPDEAESLLNEHLGLGIEHADVEELVRRTEGWPAGLYLAALSLHNAEDPHDFVGRFGGTSRAVVDFLVDEVLRGYEEELQTLMVRCSVLERLGGPLCDAVLDDDGTADVLRSLCRTNLFLLPLDDSDEWYRFHNVFAQLLRVELEHREPGLAATLHLRAHEWYRDQGLIDEAIDHAIGARAFDAARELISATWARSEKVLAWLEQFPAELKQQDAHLLALEAAARGDVGGGLAHARRALEPQEHDADFWPGTCWVLAIGEYFTGRPAEADRWFAEAIDAAPATGQWIVMASALAYRSVIAGEQGRLHDQDLLADEAAQLAGEHGSAGEAHVARAICAVVQGEPAEAPALLERGVQALRSAGRPSGVVAFALIQQARMLRAIGDRDGAAAATGEARAVVDGCADPGVLRQWVAELEGPPRRTPSAPTFELSQRERSVLRMLTGPLSERDIGRELYLSHNTIHSHTRSIYRKLGASSRAEAIERARELGLL